MAQEALPVEASPAPVLIGTLILRGDPMPMPRARARIAGKAGGKQWVQFYEPAAALDRQGDFNRGWRRLGVPPEPSEARLLLRALFVFMRPSYHYGTGRNASVLKDRYRHVRPGKGGGVTKDLAGGEHPTGGDLDNLIKLVKDGLTCAAYEDDGAVVELAAEKSYVEQTDYGEPVTAVQLLRLP